MPRIAVSTRDFLRTGEFGPIRPGLSRDALRGLLGDPEGWSLGPGKRKPASRAAIWQYGDVEFHFNGDTLWLIFADHITTLKGGKAIDLDPWVLNGNATVKQVLGDLEEAHIPFQRIDWKFDDTTERFRVGAGVDLLFWDENQYGPNDDDLPTLARPDMTFCGFSYSSIATKTE